MRSPYEKKEFKVLCYKCGEYGYLGFGWVKSSYSSPYPYIPNREYGKYVVHYIRHYSSAKYQEMMKRYKSHEIKSRPNGQKRCYVSRDVRFYRNGECHFTFCSYELRPLYDTKWNKIGEAYKKREERLSRVSEL